jgi:hypothetical protein
VTQHESETPKTPASPVDVFLAVISEQVLNLSEAQLQSELQQLGPIRTPELAERLRPFETPVTERTMRRSTRS